MNRTEHEVLFDEMLVLYSRIQELKPQDRTALDRAYAITASKMEDVISNHFTWVINRPKEANDLESN